jgi:hypothetical protein
VKSTIKLKRDKMKEAFDMIRNVLNDFTSKDKEETEYKQKYITFEIFHKLLKLIDPSKKDNQIKILFKLIDSDDNKILSNFEL